MRYNDLCVRINIMYRRLQSFDFLRMDHQEQWLLFLIAHPNLFLIQQPKALSKILQ